MVPIRPVLLIFSILVLVTSRAQADGADTCDGGNPRTCCEKWAAIESGKQTLIRDTFEKAKKAIENRQEMAEKLCRFWGPDSADCTTRYEGPVCYVPPSSKPGCDADARAIDAAIDKIARDQEDITRTANAYKLVGRALGKALTGSNNPFTKIGDQTINHAARVGEAIQRVRALRDALANIQCTKSLPPSGDVRALWQPPGRPFSSPLDRTDDADAQLAQITDTLRKLPPRVELKRLSELALSRDYLVSEVKQRRMAGHVAIGGVALALDTKVSRGTYTLGGVLVDKNGNATITDIAVHWSHDRNTLTFELGQGVSFTLTMIPDEDGDGVLDKDDRCPADRGPATVKGCPDADNDLVADLDDQCRRISGPAPTGCPPLQACSQQQQQGTDAAERHVIGVGKRKGKVTLSWDHYDIPDRIRVYYEGQIAFDTYCTAGSGTHAIPFDGGESAMEVEVLPNCAGDRGTGWSFTLGCAR